MRFGCRSPLLTFVEGLMFNDFFVKNKSLKAFKLHLFKILSNFSNKIVYIVTLDFHFFSRILQLCFRIYAARCTRFSGPLRPKEKQEGFATGSVVRWALWMTLVGPFVVCLGPRSHVSLGIVMAGETCPRIGIATRSKRKRSGNEKRMRGLLRCRLKS